MTSGKRFSSALIGLVLITQLPGCGGDSSSGQSVALPITVTVLPGSALVPAGTGQALNATLQNDADKKGVTWSLSPASGAGTLSDVTSTSVTFNAPSSPPAADVAVTITATSVASNAASASSTVTVPAIVVSVLPASGSVLAGATQSLTATVQYDPGQMGVTWAISPATGAGTLSDITSTTVTYNAPATPPASDVTVTITATSVSSKVVSASASLTVPANAVSITPATAFTSAGGTQSLTATLVYDPGQLGVTWTISPATGAGTLSDITSTSVTYNAPASPPPSDVPVTITATSVASTSVSMAATITVLASVVSITPMTANVAAGGSQLLTAIVQYDPGQTGVTWTISPATGAGTLSDITATSVTYNAPASAPPSPQIVTITATSINIPTVAASATITVPVIAVNVSPASALMPARTVQAFGATTINDPTTLGVTWSLNQGGAACAPACGTVTAIDSSTANYTAPAAPPSDRTVTIVASSVADATKFGSASISLTTGTVQLVPMSLNFGRIPKTSSKVLHVTLTNAGSTPLAISAITISGPGAVKFTQTNTCAPSVGAAASCDIAVTFVPNKTIGTYNATLGIADDSTDSPQQITLVGVSYSSAKRFAAVRSVLTSEKRVTAPAPTGANRVGTRVVELVDAARPDPYLADGSRRKLVLRFWYPASVKNGCQPAPYTDARVWNYFSGLLGARLPAVQTNSCLQARVLEGAFPVVIFTHGFTGTFTDYTFLFEDLASRGYVVASVDHTYEATAVAFPDGQFAKSVLGSHLQHNTHADEQALTAAEATRLADLQFVVAELQRLNGDSKNAFYGHLDTTSIAVAGHSLGGLTALQAVQRDPRIRAAVSLEGLMPDVAFEATNKPVLLLDADRTHWTENERRLWGKLQGPRYAVNLTNAEHVAPTDAVWLAPGAIETGGVSPERTVAAVRDFVAAFLGASLQGQPAGALLTQPSPKYAGVEVGGPQSQ